MSKSKHQIEKLREEIRIHKESIRLHRIDIVKKERQIRKILHPYLKEG